MYNDDFEIMFITRNILIFILIPMILVMYPWYIHKCVYIIMHIQIYQELYYMHENCYAYVCCPQIMAEWWICSRVTQIVNA